MPKSSLNNESQYRTNIWSSCTSHHPQICSEQSISSLPGTSEVHLGFYALRTSNDILSRCLLPTWKTPEAPTVFLQVIAQAPLGLLVQDLGSDKLTSLPLVVQLRGSPTGLNSIAQPNQPFMNTPFTRFLVLLPSFHTILPSITS